MAAAADPTAFYGPRNTRFPWSRTGAELDAGATCPADAPVRLDGLDPDAMQIMTMDGRCVQAAGSGA
jgi:hypothetical protein